MIFGEVALADAEGAILAHSKALDRGRLKKGTRLSADDIARLREAGVPVELDVVPGAPHGFDGWGKGVAIADDFTGRSVAWLRGALGS